MTQVEVLFTFWPPWPPERTKLSSRSVSRTPSAAMRWANAASFSEVNAAGFMHGKVVEKPMTGNRDIRHGLPGEQDKAAMLDFGPSRPKGIKSQNAEKAPFGTARGQGYGVLGGGKNYGYKS